MRNWVLVGLSVLALTACAPPPLMMPAPAPPIAGASQTITGPEQAAKAFVQVVARVEPVAEQMCMLHAPNRPCRFQIAVDDRLDIPPNAFQTLDARGQPILVFTLPLILEARNEDELAFVMGHEAAHHILGHMAQQEQSAMAGAMVAGTLATLGGATAADVQAAQDMGAELGARTFAKDYELQADALGTEIAWRAGFNPAVGAQFFARMPDPGDKFLGSHPPNAQRIQLVDRTLATLQAQAQ